MTHPDRRTARPPVVGSVRTSRRVLMFLLASTALTLGLAPSGERPPRATDFKVLEHALVLPGPIVFRGATAELDLEASRAALFHVVDYLDAKKAITLMRVEGHVAASVTAGDAPAAQELSERRAVAVARWLVSEGVDAKRLLVVGFGNTKPLAAGDVPPNTRITLVNAQLRNRNIGGLPPDGGGKVVEPDTAHGKQ